MIREKSNDQILKMTREKSLKLKLVLKEKTIKSMSLTKLPKKKKKEMTQIISIRDERGTVTADPTDIRTII